MITLPEGVPPAVAQSFASLIPAAVAITLIWLISVILNFDINHFFTLLLSPLVSGLGSLPGMLVLIFLISLLWCCGIHGDNVLSGITSPIFLKYISENTQAYLHHQPIPHITADGFYIVFMCLGGTGATMGLVIAMLRSRSRLYKSVGKLSLPSAIFCINEPVIFGCPIVFNPLLMIPFTLTPMILCISTWSLMYFDIIGRPVLQIPWTMPPIFAAWFVTGGNIPAVIWSICTLVISALVWLPFSNWPSANNLKPKRPKKMPAATRTRFPTPSCKKGTTMKKLKVVTIGGGSSYTPELIDGFIKRYAELPVTDYYLLDIEEGKEKLEIVGKLAQRMVAEAGLPMNIHLTLDREEALKDADFVTTQLRVGFLDARINDEKSR